MGTVETTMSPVSTLVDMVKSSEIELPEIQRNYVWNRPQVRDLLDSIYRGYPVGTVLMWQAEESPIAKALAVGQVGSSQNPTKFLLDGQQRLTSLTRVFTSADPDIRFNLETERFEVANAVIKRDPHWVPVVDVFRKGAITVAMERNLVGQPETKDFLERLNRLEGIKSYLVPVHLLKGFEYEEVTEIFVRVNSRGTRLREAELAIARLAFRLPGMVTDRLKTFEHRIDGKGYDIDLRFLMRCLTAVTTGQSRFGPLASVTAAEVEAAWGRTERGVNHFLNLLKQNLGIESASWLPSLNALVVPVAYFANSREREVDARQALRWFIVASTWGRYAGSVETHLDQDLRAIANPDPFPAMIETIRQSSGGLEVTANDLDDAGVQSPFFLVMYLACRRNQARDWWSDVELSTTNLGTEHLLELHHIFPRGKIKDLYPQKDVNELANMAFLSKKKNLEISMEDPAVYLPTIPPERLRQQFIPLKSGLWKIERFQEFSASRRELLAVGINDLFRSLE